MSELWIPTPDEVAAIRRTLEQQDARIAELEAQLAAAIESNDGLRSEFLRAAVQRGIAETELAAARRWEPIEDAYWGHINIEDNGTSIAAQVDMYELENGYLVAKLPAGYVVCRVAGEGEGGNAPGTA